MASIPKDVKLWPYRRIPYTFESGFPFKKDVRKAMDKWQDAAGVSFVERVNEPNYLMICRPQKGSSSNVGMTGGEQKIFIGNEYIGLHELGHALGLIHEQSRSDRDEYIEVQWDNIEDGEKNRNFIIDTDCRLTEYDLKSVMHYPAPATGWQGKPSGSKVWTMRLKEDREKKLGAGNYQGWEELSENDKKGARSAYDCVSVPIGPETDHGKWDNAYEIQFHYKINHNLYFYGQNIKTNYWFIQRFNSNGTMGDEIQGGFWKYPYGVQFPFKLGEKQYFYGQKISSGYNWFIQQLKDA